MQLNLFVGAATCRPQGRVKTCCNQKMMKQQPLRHSRVGGNPVSLRRHGIVAYHLLHAKTLCPYWIPAFAGMTDGETQKHWIPAFAEMTGNGEKKGCFWGLAGKYCQKQHFF
jgi:hypothetical protein